MAAPTDLGFTFEVRKNGEVAIGRDGRVITVVAGEADTTRHTPMTPAARMLQGSVGKTYFAALAMRLVGEGRLEIGVSFNSVPTCMRLHVVDVKKIQSLKPSARQ